jgi:hypothetical protein
MKTKTIEVFSFDELTEAAKENARAWFRDGFEYSWMTESQKSIEHFCAAFNIRIDFSIGTYRGYSYSTSAHNDDFRGLTFEEAANMPLSDGYWIGETLKDTFLRYFNSQGALIAFDLAIDQAFVNWLEDLEYQETDDYIDEILLINDYEFDYQGERA